jgi:hypothetical protein
LKTCKLWTTDLRPWLWGNLFGKFRTFLLYSGTGRSVFYYAVQPMPGTIVLKRVVTLFMEAGYPL